QVNERAAKEVSEPDYCGQGHEDVSHHVYLAGRRPREKNRTGWSRGGNQSFTEDTDQEEYPDTPGQHQDVAGGRPNVRWGNCHDSPVGRAEGCGVHAFDPAAAANSARSSSMSGQRTSTSSLNTSPIRTSVTYPFRSGC